MRRATGIAVVYRSVGGFSAMPEVAGNHTHSHLPRIFHTALFSTKSPNFSSRTHSVLSNKLAYQSAGRGGSRNCRDHVILICSYDPAEEVHAKEPVLEKFRPGEVVLCQYEACPFCNKVKAAKKGGPLTSLLSKLSAKVKGRPVEPPETPSTSPSFINNKACTESYFGSWYSCWMAVLLQMSTR